MRIKRCQPGFICFDHVGIVVAIAGIVGVGYYMYATKNTQTQPNYSNRDENINVNVDVGAPNTGYFGIGGWLPSFPYNNLPMGTDPLINPYNPPFRDERYMVGPALGPIVPSGTVPINVATSSINTSYRQVGILTPLNESSTDSILPLMGRPLFTKRSKWQYYSISNQHNNVKLPILVKQRNGLNDNGVDELYSGDTVMVEGMDKPFKVTQYEDSTIQYLPYL